MVELSLEKVYSEDRVDEDDQAAHYQAVAYCRHCCEEGANGETKRLCLRNLLQWPESSQAPQHFEGVEYLVDCGVPELESAADVDGRVDSHAHGEVYSVLTIHDVSFLARNGALEEAGSHDPHASFKQEDE